MAGRKNALKDRMGGGGDKRWVEGCLKKRIKERMKEETNEERVT